MKIFINDVTVDVLKQAELQKLHSHSIINLNNFKKFVLEELKNPTSNENYYLSISSKKDLKETLKNEFQVIKAAGGVVKQNDKILAIFRNGKWDIPKGKVEKGERIKKAAIREVEEECGIKGVQITRKLTNTYHIYKLRDNIILKKTSWYKMTCNKLQKLIPQINEGITEVKWVDKEFLEDPKIETYKSIRELMKKIKQA